MDAFAAEHQRKRPSTDAGVRIRTHLRIAFEKHELAEDRGDLSLASSLASVRPSLWVAIGQHSLGAIMSSRVLGAWCAAVVTIVAAMPAAAGPINVSLFPPIAIVQPPEGVTAFRLDLLYGKNTSVKVVDLGLINQTTSTSNGLQWGLVNYNEGAFSGLQLAAVSYNKGSAGGLQWSGFNYAGTASGLQLALVNYAEKLDGFQVGFLNIAKTGGMFPVMVIANWKK
jgi:hypothetical protein